MIHFELTADPACSVAQGVLLALRHCGHAPALTRCNGAATELLQRQGSRLGRSRGAIAVLDAASTHIGAQPTLLSHLLPLPGLLEQIGATREPQDLDLHIFQLRALLGRLEQHIATGSCDTPPGLADCLLAAIWWRISVLDRHFATFIGLGFAALQRHCQRILIRSDAEDVLDDRATTLLVGRIAASRAVISPGDMLPLWQNGLGPEAGTLQLRH